MLTEQPPETASDEAAKLLEEAKELQKLLESVQGSSRNLMRDTEEHDDIDWAAARLRSEAAKKRVVSAEQRREKAGSSWGKSGVKRGGHIGSSADDGASQQSVLDTAKGERQTKQRAAMGSSAFSKSVRSDPIEASFKRDEHARNMKVSARCVLS